MGRGCSCLRRPPPPRAALSPPPPQPPSPFLLQAVSLFLFGGSGWQLGQAASGAYSDQQRKNHVHVRDWGYRGVWHTRHTMSCLGRAPRTQILQSEGKHTSQACIAVLECLGGAYGSVRTPVKPESDGHQSRFARCPEQI